MHTSVFLIYAHDTKYFKQIIIKQLFPGGAKLPELEFMTGRTENKNKT